MNNYYEGHERFFVALDCIIFGFDRETLNLLLMKRNFEPEKGKWSLMGGFLKRDTYCVQNVFLGTHKIKQLEAFKTNLCCIL